MGKGQLAGIPNYIMKKIAEIKESVKSLSDSISTLSSDISSNYLLKTQLNSVFSNTNNSLGNLKTINLNSLPVGITQGEGTVPTDMNYPASIQGNYQHIIVVTYGSWTSSVFQKGYIAQLLFVCGGGSFFYRSKSWDAAWTTWNAK